MKQLTKVKSIKAHNLTWLYYKTITGQYRYITPKTGQDRGPFLKLKHLRDYIESFGNNINWQ